MARRCNRRIRARIFLRLGWCFRIERAELLVVVGSALRTAFVGVRERRSAVRTLHDCRLRCHAELRLSMNFASVRLWGIPMVLQPAPKLVFTVQARVRESAQRQMSGGAGQI